MAQRTALWACRLAARSTQSVMTRQHARRLIIAQGHGQPWRCLSTEGGPGAGSAAHDRKEGGGSDKSAGKEDAAEGGEREELPPEEQVSAGALAGTAAVLLLAAFCGYHIVKELFPGQMNPNAIFNRATEALQSDPDTCNHFGTPLVSYGRDGGGGTREGRRNFVESVDYVSPDDGSNRRRIRFNIKGPYGRGGVYAEVSNKMASNEWVYLMVQDLQTGHVINLQDNRAELATRAAASSEEERDALSRLLHGGGGASRT